MTASPSGSRSRAGGVDVAATPLLSGDCDVHPVRVEGGCGSDPVPPPARAFQGRGGVRDPESLKRAGSRGHGPAPWKANETGTR